MIINEDGNHRHFKIRASHVIVWTVTVIAVVLGIRLIFWILPKDDADVDALLNETLVIETEPPEPEHVMTVPDPGIDEQLISINQWSRPGTLCDPITAVVIHYLGNPETTAQENRDYFEELKDNQELIDSGEIKKRQAISMSANYVIGIEGEIIECVPPGEIAYASNSANSYSVSIETCHVDETGKLTDATYDSLVKMTAYVLDMYDLGRDAILRHYDITGKECPLYYVDHPDEWEKFKDDVMDYLEECREAAADE